MQSAFSAFLSQKPEGGKMIKQKKSIKQQKKIKLM
jgi:hypothetical protein